MLCRWGNPRAAFNTEEEGNTFIRNVGIHSHRDTVSHVRILELSSNAAVRNSTLALLLQIIYFFTTGLSVARIIWCGTVWFGKDVQGSGLLVYFRLYHGICVRGTEGNNGNCQWELSLTWSRLERSFPGRQVTCDRTWRSFTRSWVEE